LFEELYCLFAFNRKDAKHKKGRKVFFASFLADEGLSAIAVKMDYKVPQYRS
jgi:hypothetical protein